MYKIGLRAMDGHIDLHLSLLLKLFNASLRCACPSFLVFTGIRYTLNFSQGLETQWLENLVFDWKQ